MAARDRLAVALDVPRLEDAELFTAAGPAALAAVRGLAREIGRALDARRA